MYVNTFHRNCVHGITRFNVNLIFIDAANPEIKSPEGASTFEIVRHIHGNNSLPPLVWQVMWYHDREYNGIKWFFMHKNLPILDDINNYILKITILLHFKEQLPDVGAKRGWRGIHPNYYTLLWNNINKNLLK